MDRKGVWSWGEAIQQSDLPPPAKLACLNLYLYMNDFGAGAWPSLSKQMRDTGLARSTLIKHLQLAADRGYLFIDPAYAGGKRTSNTYRPIFPQEINLSGAPADDFGASSVVRETDQVVRETDGGGTADGRGVVRETDPNYPYRTAHINNPVNNKLYDEDGVFWGEDHANAESSNFNK